MFNRLWNRTVAAVCLVALSGVLCGAVALAGKPVPPPPPPVPPGTIYFNNWSGTDPNLSMKGDGSGKVQSTGGVPTYKKHGNSRWFIQNRTVAGIDFDQWFAVNEAGDAVQLTNDPNLRWNGYPATWAKDDSSFSICCVNENPSGLGLDVEWIGQLLVIPVAWTDGVPSAGPATMVLELRRSVFDEWGEWSWNGYDEVSLGRHDWSPAGDELALTHWVWGEGWVVDIVTFSATVASRRLATGAENPVWSPDGSRIAFNRAQGSGYQDIKDIWTIKQDGTDVLRLTTYIAGSGYNGTAQYLPTWSPDGAYLAYTERKISGKTTHNIRRIPAGGGSPTSLTSDGASSWPRWR